MKKIIILLLCIVFIVSLFNINNYFNYKKIDNYNIDLNVNKFNDSYEEQIKKFQNKYNNKDIKALLAIENTNFATVIVQSNDNEYYLNHALDKSYNKYGSTFIDYRIDLNNTKKILIFSHSSQDADLPFEIIEEYRNEKYYKEHKFLYLITEKEKRKYAIFSAYVETSDFDYMKLDFSTDTERHNHYQKLKNNSFYETEVEVEDTDEIILLQTCSELEKYQNYARKYFLLIAKRVYE